MTNQIELNLLPNTTIKINQFVVNLPPNTTIKINQFVVMIDKDGSLLAFNSQDVKLEDGDINTGVKFSAPAFKIASGEITDSADIQARVA